MILNRWFRIRILRISVVDSLGIWWTGEAYTVRGRIMVCVTRETHWNGSRRFHMSVGSGWKTRGQMSTGSNSVLLRTGQWETFSRGF